MNRSVLRGVALRLAGAVMLAVVLALAANAVLSQRIFEHALAPEMAKKVATVGVSIRGLALKAVDYGIAFDSMYGVEALFAELAAEVPEITYFGITDTGGRLLYQHPATPAAIAIHAARPEVLQALSDPQRLPPPVRIGPHHVVTLPIVGAGGALGLLHLGMDSNFVDQVMLEMLFDVLVVLVVSLFITLELLHALAGARLERAMAALSDVLARGASGEFGAARRVQPGLAFGSVIKRLEVELGRVNAAHEALSREVAAATARPPADRPAGADAAASQLARLATRFRFGRSGASAGAVADGELSRVRAPLFMFMLAEELTRSFLPGYVQQLLVPVPGLSAQLVVGLPIALFMLIVALGQPGFGVLAARWGSRRTMRVGAGVACAGFVASALAVSVLDLLLWRSLCAVGYGMVFVAAQAHVLQHTTSADRTAGFAVFVGAIMVATVCGPSVGGILADNVGERWTFAIAAVMAIASLAAMNPMPARTVPAAADAQARARLPGLGEIGMLLANVRFVGVTVLAAMPAKILLTGMGFYLVPLYVTSLQSTQAMAGRALMVYGVMVVLLTPLAAGWARSRRRMESLVGGGLVLSGVGGFLLVADAGIGPVFGAMALLGAGQALSMSAQSALVGEHCRLSIERFGESAVYAVYRLLERLGNAAGPIIAATLVTWVGYRASFVALGGFVVSCGLIFAALAWWFARADRRAG